MSSSSVTSSGLQRPSAYWRKLRAIGSDTATNLPRYGMKLNRKMRAPPQHGELDADGGEHGERQQPLQGADEGLQGDVIAHGAVDRLGLGHDLLGSCFAEGRRDPTRQAPTGRVAAALVWGIILASVTLWC
jgi:hypothetical protein